MIHSKRITSLAFFALLLSACHKDLVSPDPSPGGNSVYNLATSTFSASLISSVKTETGSTNSIATLIKGVTYYTDRTYTLTAVPDSLSNLQMIKTANVDKRNSSSSYLSFVLNQPATVYIAFDPRVKSLPSWLKTWTKLKAIISLNDSKVSYYSIYSKNYPTGSVSLGGASAVGASGVLNQYFIFAKPNITSAKPIENVNNAFMLGVNGHSLGLPAYMTVTQEEQISLLVKMGMTCYRQNINISADGSIPLPNIFQPLYRAAAANGITLLPMINASNLVFSMSDSEAYSAGKLLGVKTATKNASYFKYYELGNEIDNLVINGGNGDVAEDYDSRKLKIAASYLKGMDDGIKSIQPSAKTMIDAGWLHTYFMQYMINYGNKFDIVAWHWYSDMESTAARIKIPDISLKLSGMFNKPIWFTEVGQRPDAVANIEKVQSDFLSSFVKKVKQNPKVGAVLCYELFDEPDRSNAEKSFGLLKWTSKYNKYAMKIAAQTFMSGK